MKKRLVWSKGWQDTRTTTERGVELRVKFQHGSSMWTVYVDGVPIGRKCENRAMAKRHASSYRNAIPKHTITCLACNGTGRIKKA